VRLGVTLAHPGFIALARIIRERRDGILAAVRLAQTAVWRA
jgi:hypothetical protein